MLIRPLNLWFPVTARKWSIRLTAWKPWSEILLMIHRLTRNRILSRRRNFWTFFRLKSIRILIHMSQCRFPSRIHLFQFSILVPCPIEGSSTSSLVLNPIRTFANTTSISWLNFLKRVTLRKFQTLNLMSTRDLSSTLRITVFITRERERFVLFSIAVAKCKAFPWMIFSFPARTFSTRLSEFYFVFGCMTSHLAVTLKRCFTSFVYDPKIAIFSGFSGSRIMTFLNRSRLSAWLSTFLVLCLRLQWLHLDFVT